jgi:hypothetical protein
MEEKRMKPLSILFLCLSLASCAGYKEVKVGSREFHDLKPGDIIWVYTGVVDRERAMFYKIEGDSIVTDKHSFHVDSVTRIQKEYKSSANTGMLLGGVTTIVVVAAVAAVAAAVAIFSFYVNFIS